VPTSKSAFFGLFVRFGEEGSQPEAVIVREASIKVTDRGRRV